MKPLISPNRRGLFFAKSTVTAFLGLCLVLPIHVFAQSRLEVSRDKEKTVYSIGSDNKTAQDEAADKEKAWQMLNNMGIKVDRRNGNLPQGGSGGTQTAPRTSPAPTTANQP